MRRILCLILFIAGLSQAIQANDSIEYKVISTKASTLIELPFSMGIVTPGYLGLGVKVKKYLVKDIRLDIGYNAQLLFGEGEYDPMTYATELVLKGNYPLIRKTIYERAKVPLSHYYYSSVPAVKYKYLNIHGGYQLRYPGHKLVLGLNYTSNKFVKIDYLNSPTRTRKRLALNYFDVGAELLLSVGYLEYENNYYIPAGEDFSKIGVNLFTNFYTMFRMLGSFEIGWHDTPYFIVGIGLAFGN